MAVVEVLQHVEEYPPAGIVVIHADLLSDDALFLCHALRREVGGLDEGEEDVQRFLCAYLDGSGGKTVIIGKRMDNF